MKNIIAAHIQAGASNEKQNESSQVKVNKND